MTDANKDRLRELNTKLGVTHKSSLHYENKALKYEKELKRVRAWLDQVAALYEKRGYSANAQKFRATIESINKVLK